MNEQNNADAYSQAKLYNILELAIVLLAVVLFFLRYLGMTPDLSYADDTISRAALYLQNGNLGIAGADLIPALVRSPARFLYASLLNLFLLFVTEYSDALLLLNTVLLLIIAIPAYRIVRRIGGRTCGLLVFLLILFLPLEIFSCVISNYNLLFLASVFLALYLSILLFLGPHDTAWFVVLATFAGLFWGLSVFMYFFVALLLFALVFIFMIPLAERIWPAILTLAVTLCVSAAFSGELCLFSGITLSVCLELQLLNISSFLYNIFENLTALLFALLFTILILSLHSLLRRRLSDDFKPIKTEDSPVREPGMTEDGLYEIPLPMPEEHVRKKMDFESDYEDIFADFDHKVPDTDDFDH